jgi:cysteine desulfurase family protein
MIYLDNGATSFPKPKVVIEAVEKAMLAPASPGRGGHKPALEASRIVYRARKNIGKLFGIKDIERTAFTPNITYALNIALFGLDLKPGDHALSSSLEHNSVGRPLNLLVKERGIVWETVPPRGDGLLYASDFQKKITPKTRLIALSHASNVTGALAPAREIKEIAGKDIILVLDTAQTAGSIPMEDLGEYADIVCFTGHKGLLGPTGTGGLCLKEGITLRSLALGGTGSRSESLEHPDFMPDSLEAGTLNVHGLAGLAAGVGFILETGLSVIREHEMTLTRTFMEEISQIKGLAILGPGLGIDRRVATVSVIMDRWSSSDLARRLEEDYGIMIRAGLHCSPLAHHSLSSYPGGAARFSFGYFNTIMDAKTAARALFELSKIK